MSISEPIGPYGDDERDEPLDGENGGDSLGNEPDGASPGEETPFDEDKAYEGEELNFSDEEERLPWLEGDEDEEDHGGHSAGQTLALVLVVLLGIALIGGGIWWFSREQPDSGLVADGGTIKNEGAYKERPADPGGKTFEGTDDSAPKVAEGQTTAARLGIEDPQPAPGFDTPVGGQPDRAGASAGNPPASAGATGKPSVAVQLAAYKNRAAAEDEWNRLVQQHAPLKGLRHRVVEGKVDFGTVFRLQALADNAQAAKALCAQLAAARVDCMVKP